MRKFVAIVFAMLIVICMAVPCFALEDYSEAPAVSEEDELAGEIEEEAKGWIEVLLSITPQEWRGYIEEKVVPVVLLAVSAVTTALAALLPVLGKIKEGSTAFQEAKEDLKEATKKSKEARETVKETRKSVMKEYDVLRGEFKGVKDGYEEMKESLANIESILRLAFENTDELIRKGCANRIAKVGKEDVEKDEEA